MNVEEGIAMKINHPVQPVVYLEEEHLPTSSLSYEILFREKQHILINLVHM